VSTQKFLEEQPFFSLMVTPRDTYETQPLLNRLTLALLEVVAGLGLFIVVGLLSVALWSVVVPPSAPLA
jgi:hypothetical protein